MLKHVQLLGKKKWFGQYFLDIQNEQYKITESLLSQYATACIWSGCIVTVNVGDPTKYDISAGIVFMKDPDGVYQFAPFAGVTAQTLPGYIILSKAATNALYGDGNSKNIYITTSGAFQTAAPGAGVDYLHFTSAGATTYKDVLGIGTPVGAPEAWRNVNTGGQPALIDNTKVTINTLRFRKDTLGFVEIQGNLTLKNYSVGDLSHLFTLPAGYIPAAGITYVTGTAFEDNGTGNMFPLIINQSDGEVRIQTPVVIGSGGVTVHFYFLFRI